MFLLNLRQHRMTTPLFTVPIFIQWSFPDVINHSQIQSNQKSINHNIIYRFRNANYTKKNIVVLCISDVIRSSNKRFKRHCGHFVGRHIGKHTFIGQYKPRSCLLSPPHQIMCDNVVQVQVDDGELIVGDERKPVIAWAVWESSKPTQDVESILV